jgi:ribosomal protein L11 methyltransferase
MTMASGDQPPLDGLNTDGLDLGGTETIIGVTVPSALGDVVADRFWQLGVRAVSEVDVGDGLVEVSSSVGNEQASVDRAIATFDADWSVRVTSAPVAGADDWKQFARPVEYAPGAFIVPAWNPTPTEPHVERVTVIEPGSAFGLGDHPTTTGSMQLVADVLSGATRDDESAVGSVLDVGCGTGALAILAAQMGVPTIRAIDVAIAAVDATLHNADLNDVAGRIDVDATPIAALEGSYDLVVANILAPVLVSLADDLVRLTAPGGSLIISGILEERHDHVLAALAPLVPSQSVVRDGWITIRLTHP